MSAALVVAMVLIIIIFARNPAGNRATGSQPTTGPALSSPTESLGPVPGTAKLSCAKAPITCGYPDTATTGVQDNVALSVVPDDVRAGRGWHWDDRGWLEIDGQGAVVENLRVNANVDVTASRVTIRNVQIVLGGDTFGVSLRRVHDVTIEHSEIGSPDSGAQRLLVGIKDVYGDSAGTRVIGNDIHGAATGVQIYEGLVQDNYIHDLGFREGDHVNGMTSNGGSSQLTIRHNTVLNPHQQTDAISLFQDFGVEANRIIDDNLVAGGTYSIYAGANPGATKQTSNIQVTRNRFSRIYFPNGGQFGPVTAFDPSGHGNVWSGNVWDETDQPVGS